MIRNLLVAAASVLVTLAAFEMFLRVFGAEVLPRPDLYVLDADTGKRMRPGWEGDEFGAPVRINSKGLRNPEVEYAKPTGVYRVLALGDSWTFGFRMQEPDAYPRKLETKLNERAEARGELARYEVINAGVIGYSTAQEAAWLRTEGYKYDADLVVVAYYPVNDTHEKLAKYERYQRLREIHPWLLEAYTFPRELYLRQFIKGTRRALRRRLGEARVVVAERVGYDDPVARATVEDDWTIKYSPENPGWREAQEALREIGSLTEDAGQDALVVLLPDTLDLERYLDRYHPRVAPLVRETVRSARMDFLDLAETFEPWRDRNDQIRHPGERHPNALGYDLIADRVAREIEARYRGLEDALPGVAAGDPPLGG